MSASVDTQERKKERKRELYIRMPSTLSATREGELDSVAAGEFENRDGVTILSSVGTCFKLSPEHRWKNETHFHSDLHVPDESSSKQDGCCTLLLCFEARAREGIAVALSAESAKFKGTEIVFGSSGNTCTEMRHTKRMRVSVAGRVCREDVWVSYWIAVCQNKMFAGVGPTPGSEVVASLDLNHRSSKGAATKAVLDESTKEEERNASLDARSVETDAAVGVPLDVEAGDKQVLAPVMRFRYVGLRYAGKMGDLQQSVATHVRIRNLELSAVPAELLQQLSSRLDSDALDMVILGEHELESLSTTDKEAVTLLCQYRDACDKAKARAVKFGVPYQAPDLAATLPWSHARRLLANPSTSTGFATGMDLHTDAEKAKQEQRKARFGSSNKDDDDEAEEDAAISMETDVAALPIEQAWDKIDLVGIHRVDPPALLWKDPPPAQEDKDEFRLQHDEPVFVGEKIHMVSIDWAAFKQIRSNDIVSHFSIYGPTYVEWLGDLSCNVLFEDKFSAARALENLSQELPSPPPPPGQGDDDDDGEGVKTTAGERPDLGRMGWRFGKMALRKVSDDRFGKRWTAARLLMRVATSLDILHERPNKWPKPPAGFTTQSVLGPESDLPNKATKKAKKKRKKKNDVSGTEDHRNDASSESNVTHGPVTTESLMSAGLRSSRAGFSVAEMEAERTKKMAKMSLL